MCWVWTLLLGLILRRPNWCPRGTPGSMCSHVLPCRPVVEWAFDWWDVPRSSMLHVCFLLPSAVPSTFGFPLRNTPFFWNWYFSFQFGSLPLFPVVLHNKILWIPPPSSLLSSSFLWYLLLLKMQVQSATRSSILLFMNWRTCTQGFAHGSRNQCDKVNPGLSNTDFSNLRLRMWLFYKALYSETHQRALVDLRRWIQASSQ